MSDERNDSVERLRAGVEHVRSRGRATFPVGRWMMITGGALATLGVIAILLGWLGASRTPYVFEQIPYMISGGLLGVALACLGGLFYFAYWMTRTLEESRVQSDATMKALGRIEELLVPRNGSGPAGHRGNGAPFVRTGKGTMFHRPDCVVVSGRDDLTPVAESGEDFVPCKICEPLATV